MGDCGKKDKKSLKDRNKVIAVPEVEGEMGKPRSETPTGSSKESAKDSKRKRPTRERWLLTRKTWRYMADAGRRLIPEGAHNRPEDIPKIEAYFQEVCHREPRFLLWRKSSYPGALGFRSHRKNRRDRNKGGSCREKASSADEADEIMAAGNLVLTPTGGGRFDLHKLRQDFLHRPSTSKAPSEQGTSKFRFGRSIPEHKSNLPDLPEVTTTSTEDTAGADVEEKEFLNTLLLLLNQHGDTEGASTSSEGKPIDYQKFVDQLRKYLPFNEDTRKQDSQMRSAAGRGAYGRQMSSESDAGSRSEYSKWGGGLSSGGDIRRRASRPASSSPPSFISDQQQAALLNTLKRYYNRSTNRQQVISDLLTDRKLLEKLYYDLRHTRGFKGRRDNPGSGWKLPESDLPFQLRRREDKPANHEEEDEEEYEQETEIGSWKRLGKPAPHQRALSPFSPPPLIEVQPEEPTRDRGIQTDPISATVLAQIEEELRKERAKEEKEDKETKSQGSSSRRRSSVDHDDVSQSVSDTIKRYLRMARKKSIDGDKADRFKRVNYDRNLRNIKPKGEITKPGDDDGLNKGSQSDESWINAMKELKLDDIPVSSDQENSANADECGGSRVTSSRSSLDGNACDDGLLSPPVQVFGKPGLLSSGQSFLSNLLHGLQHHQQQQQQQQQPQQQGQGGSGPHASTPVTVGAAMQKSKSSSSVVHHGSRLVAKKIWRARSKSQSRATSSGSTTWTPQGGCSWNNVTGRQVILADTTMLQLSDVERRVLQKVALAKLQALNLGVSVRVPNETVGSTPHKPKRRAYILKRKALTTGFFDTARGKDGDKEKDVGGAAAGLVFGIPISQCILNDRVARVNRGGSPFLGRGDGDEPAELRRKSHHGSRSSFSSLIETSPRTEESGSCESLMSPTERMAGSVPGLLDSLSCGSTADISAGIAGDWEPGIPHVIATCFKYIESYGLHTLGIFRVSSSKKRVRQLREDFDCGKDITLEDEQCPHDVATLIKEFFRDLPEPLLSRDLYQPFVQTQRIRNRRLQFEALQHLIQLLPAPNRDTLWALLNFLATVARNSTDYKDGTGEWVLGNKMDSNNLATLFAPNILHSLKPGNKDLPTDNAEERIDVINVIRSMIEHNKSLFHVSAEMLDEVYVHMMDSHPDALDQLLRKRDTAPDDVVDDLESNATDGGGSECYSVPRTPTSLGELQEPLLGLAADSDDLPAAVRRVWSREEFLHETAGMGGPDMAMRPSSRHKDRDRGREKSTKKRWKEESGTRRGDAESTEITRTLTGSSATTTSSSSSQISIMSARRHRVERTTSTQSQQSQQPEEAAHKLRSSSVDATPLAPDGGEVAGRTSRLTEDQDPRRQSSPLVHGVITASLKIPVGTGAPFSLNLDDSDIPYIEDGSGYNVTAEGRQQMTIGLVRSTASSNVMRRRRQRSVSGSDSSQASTSVHPGVATLLQQGYDSAIGSSATFSSPPRNTTPSICSSSGGEAGVFSSPPSWASTPPMSPDGTVTAVNYIPEDFTQHRISITTSKGVSTLGTSPVTSTLAGNYQRTSEQKATTVTTKEVAPVILQKVTFTSTSELQQVQRGDKREAAIRQTSVTSQKEYQGQTSAEQKSTKTKDRFLSYQKTYSSGSSGDLPKSASTSAVMGNRKTVDFGVDPPVRESERKLTSISSIGGAVMRSKTADIERMLRIQKGDKLKLANPVPVQEPAPVEPDDKKKYSKRRYTDSRHQTRHIPDAESLQETPTPAPSADAVRQRKSQQQGPVYKRRELIASDPNKHETFL